MTGLPDGLSRAHTRQEGLTAVSKGTLAKLIELGRLRELWSGILVPRELVLDPDARATAALLLAGERSVLCGPTAARLHGCPAAATPDVHVLLPYDRWVRSRAGLVVHHGRWRDEDVRAIGGLRVLALDLVVADLLCTAGQRFALGCADQAAALFAPEQRADFRDAVAERIRIRADRRGTLDAMHLLDLATGKAQSPPESWLRLLVANAGFPPPEAQYEIRNVRGRRIYVLDLAWPELRIALEYDGYDTHEGREQEDELRDLRLAKRGWLTIRVTASDLNHPMRLLDELAAAFRARGVLVG